MYAKSKNIYPACVSKHNSKCEKEVIFLMILNEGKWHYLAVKTLSALLRGITSKNHGAFSFAAGKKKLGLHKKVYENKDFRNVIMPSEDAKILEFNHYQKSD